MTTVQDIASEQEVQDNNDESEEEQYANDGSESESESNCDDDDDDDDDDEDTVSDRRRTTAGERLAARYIPQEVQANIIATHRRCLGIFSLFLLQGTAESVV